MSTRRNTGPRSSWARHIARVGTALGTAALLGGLGACTDAPSAPAIPAPSDRPSAGLITSTVSTLTNLVEVQTLLRGLPLLRPVTVSKTIPNTGGEISVPGTDFKLVVPNGAFSATSMTFTVTAYPGLAVAYDFQPHGTKFLKPLKGVQQLNATNWLTLKLLGGMTSSRQGAYFADPRQIDPLTGRAFVSEFMPTTFTVGGSTMTWDIPHFSGYLVAWGRKGSADAE
jgi:hypothetical protein